MTLCQLAGKQVQGFLSEAYEPQGFREFSNGLETIAARDGDVLPSLDIATLCDALRRLPLEELTLVLRSKLVPLVVLPGLHLFAACGKPALAIARKQGMKVVAYAKAAEL